METPRFYLYKTDFSGSYEISPFFVLVSIFHLKTFQNFPFLNIFHWVWALILPFNLLQSIGISVTPSRINHVMTTLCSK